MSQLNMRLTLLFVTSCLLCLLVGCIYVNATASSCRGPTKTSSSAKRSRGVVVLANDDPSTEQKQLTSGTTTTNDPTTTSTTKPEETNQTTTSTTSTSTSTTSTTTYPISAEAKYYIAKQPDTFHVTGPLDVKLSKRSETFRGSDKAKCVACRMDCMKKVHPEFGSFFESCRDQYYYYGCKLKQPCYESVDGDFVMEMGIGICLEKNGCIIKKELLSGLQPSDE